MNLSNIIKKPIITEKGFSLGSSDKYVFKVAKGASKNSIRDEVSRLFGVDVLNVRTAIIPGKLKRVLRTRQFSKTSQWKKAIVQLKKGQKIDFIEKGEEKK